MKVLILLNSIVFLMFGLGFVFLPETLSLFVTDSVPTTPSGLTDMRATYGGISIGFGILLGIMSRQSSLHALGTQAIVLVVGGMALGRTIGLIQDGSPNEMMYINLVLEIVIVIIGLGLLAKSRRTQAPK
ncbi:DUF4345 domain-containing protein [Pontibacter sp. G13]|uniref:DUF4345 domain-containing protein n=1 Tax=Pontibacter sp. G13 TaxID=3074898 RepID=UPI00288A4F7E|nr:DUF4345 domain-containing protein [Pontibacter sp. G13]WNJ17889.1 DUF4345 domain-containing protein [Pontibacter sp. G13]